MTQPLTPAYTPDVLDSLVQRVFNIEDITMGGPNQKFLVRYRGKIRSEDTSGAYDQLAELLQPYGLLPLFRWDGQRQAVLLVSAPKTPRPSNPWVNLVLFLLTLFSVLMAGAFYVYQPPANITSEFDYYRAVLAHLWEGWPYAVSLLAILLTHEFGHYIAGRLHKTNVTLPYFLPLPLPGLSFGTLGAFISMKAPPKNRRILVDIGMAGPLAGFIVALPILFYGLTLSNINTLPVVLERGSALSLEGNSILYLLVKFLAFGKLLPAPASYGGLSPVLYWLRYFFTSSPAPLGGMDVSLGPVAWAGWVGLLVTALNLIPVGQLDGGHLIYSLLGIQRARRLQPLILMTVVVLGIFWWGWWMWAALIFFLGNIYAEPLDEITPLDNRRKLLAALALILFLLVFTPVPMKLVSAGVF